MGDQLNLCPVCNEGCLLPKTGKNLVEYKGQAVELDLLYSVCDVCGSEQSDASQMRDNKRSVSAFKKRVDGLLTGAEVRDLRQRLGISQSEASRLFGGGPVAFSKYETDDVSQSEAMDRLLRLVSSVPEAFGYLLNQFGVNGLAAWNATGKPSPESHGSKMPSHADCRRSRNQ